MNSRADLFRVDQPFAARRRPVVPARRQGLVDLEDGMDRIRLPSHRRQDTARDHVERCDEHEAGSNHWFHPWLIVRRPITGAGCSRFASFHPMLGSFWS